MFKYHTTDSKGGFNQARIRFNKKPLWYRAYVWIKSDIIFWYLSRKQNKND